MQVVCSLQGRGENRLILQVFISILISRTVDNKGHTKVDKPLRTIDSISDETRVRAASISGMSRLTALID